MQILATKLYIPPPPSNLVPRPRLIELLYQGMARKMTLISAPAGFGKTTLLSEFVSNYGYAVAWLSLDESDNELSRFLTYFIAALRTIETGLGENALQKLQSPKPPVDKIITDLINELIASSKGRFILVIDDYNVIESQEIDRAITFFVDHMPPQMHLVIATRTDPTIPLSRLRSQGQLTEIRADDLRFSLEEAATFLEEGMGLEISAGDVAKLDSRTEGWIAGLQLAALSMQDIKHPNEIARFVESFSSSHRYILDYLTDEVLLQRPSGTKNYLLHTSILDRLSAPLCNAVTRQENSQEILESLEAANLFIVPLDNERRWYRYHHLFGDLLRMRLTQSAPSFALELHRRASAWYADNDLMPEAITHSLAAGDYERAAQLTEQTFLDRMSHGEDFATMLARLEALPNEMIQALPSLGIMYAWMLSLTFQLDAVEPQLEDVESRFSEQLPVDLQLQIAQIRAEVTRYRGDFARSIELSNKILETLPERRSAKDMQTLTGVVFNLAFAYLGLGEVAEAHKWFTDSLAISQAARSPHLALLALRGLSLVHELQGQLHRAAETCKQGLEIANKAIQEIGQTVSGVVYIHFGLGNISLEWNQLDEAEDHLVQGIDLGQRRQVGPDTLRDGYLDLSNLKLAQGNFAGAYDALQEADKLASLFQAVPRFNNPVAAHRARIRLAQAASSGDAGHLKAVERWAEEREFSIGEWPGLIYEEIEYLVWVRLLIAQNQAGEALKALEGLIRAAEEQGRMGRVIEMEMLQSLAHQVRGDNTEALAALSSALSLAEPEGYVRLFVNEGPPMEELLRQAAAQGIQTSYVSKLLGAFNEMRPAQEVVDQPLSPISPALSPLIEPLSERELEVLHLVALGLTNQEIAGKLVIAVTTAKKHVSNIIGKLGVTNRTQAVSRARKLGLL